MIPGQRSRPEIDILKIWDEIFEDKLVLSWCASKLQNLQEVVVLAKQIQFIQINLTHEYRLQPSKDRLP